VTSDDDDCVITPLSWFQSYCDQQLQLTPPCTDISSSLSDNSSVSCRRFRPVKNLMFVDSLYLYDSILCNIGNIYMYSVNAESRH